MNNQNQPRPAKSKGGAKALSGEKSLKAVAIELFKKSQRLPPLSLLTRKRGQSKAAPFPPKPFEFADFYHL
jgi:hypothetical protein